jgi:hypothetical protein
MKRLLTLWMMSLLMVLTIPAMAAMSTSKMRQHSRFLTDRMAYELNLSNSQYDDVYEVNYDFLSRTRYLIEDVAAGYTSALDEYYDYLDVRNDDLRWILTSSQYRRFLEKEYFYRPIYTTTSHTWGFRIYQVYSDINHFFFGKPSHYASYKGAHYRSNFNNVSYYKSQHRDRYQNNDVYHGDFTMGKTMKKEQENRKNQVNQNRPNASNNGNGNVNQNRSNASNNGNGNVNQNRSNSGNNGNNGKVNQSQNETSRPTGSNQNVNSNSRKDRTNNNTTTRTTTRTSTRTNRSNNNSGTTGTRSNSSRSNESGSRTTKRGR